MPTTRRRSPVVDRARVRSLLRRISGDVSDLAAEDPAALTGDARGLRAVKYSFVTAIEATIDVAQHLCASEQWGAPTTNGDAIRILARHDVLELEDVGPTVQSLVAVSDREPLTATMSSCPAAVPT